MQFNQLTPEELRLIREGKLPNRASDIGLLEALDIATTLGAGAVAEVGSGLRGLLGLAYGEDLDQAVKGMETVQDLAYEPRTYGAQKTLANVGTVLEPVGTFFENLVQSAGSNTLEATGSPEAATAAHTAAELSPDLISAAASGVFFPVLRKLRKIPDDLSNVASTPPLLVNRPPEYTATVNPTSNTFSNLEQNLLDLLMVGEETGNTKMTREQIARRLSGMGMTEQMLNESGVNWTGGKPVEIRGILDELRGLDRNPDLQTLVQSQEYVPLWPGFEPSLLDSVSSRGPATDIFAAERRALLEHLRPDEVDDILSATQGNPDSLEIVLESFFEDDPDAAASVMADVEWTRQDMARGRSNTDFAAIDTQVGELTNQRFAAFVDDPATVMRQDGRWRNTITATLRAQGATPNQANNLALWIEELAPGADNDWRITTAIESTLPPGSGEEFLGAMRQAFEAEAQTEIDARMVNGESISTMDTPQNFAARWDQVEAEMLSNQAADDPIIEIATRYMSADTLDDALINIDRDDPIGTLSRAIAEDSSMAQADEFMTAVESYVRRTIGAEPEASAFDMESPEIAQVIDAFWAQPRANQSFILSDAANAELEAFITSLPGSDRRVVRNAIRNSSDSFDLAERLDDRDLDGDEIVAEIEDIVGQDAIQQYSAPDTPTTADSTGPREWQFEGPNSTSLKVVQQAPNQFKAVKYDADGRVQSVVYGSNPDRLAEELNMERVVGDAVKWSKWHVGTPKYFRENVRLTDQSVGEITNDEHFNDKGLIAHARASGRDVEGYGKAYFVDEVQSDAHKIGRRTLYQSSPIQEGVRVNTGAQLQQARAKVDILDAQLKLLQTAIDNPRTSISRSIELHDEYDNLFVKRHEAAKVIDQINEQRNKVDRGQSMFDIPLQDNKWINSMVTQSLSKAVDRDMNGIAFTSAANQDALYLKPLRDKYKSIDRMPEDVKKQYFEMQALYEQMYSKTIPAILKKLGKKYGVEPVRVRMSDPALNKGEGKQHWYLPITPEMKKAIKEKGVPMYGKLENKLLDGVSQPFKPDGLLGLV